MSQARWQGIWSQRGLAACLLWPISVLYGALSGLRRGLYAAGLFQIHRLPVPVIVVGNVVVGGAGKTPTVIAVVKHLQAQGWRPGVVSRGYGRKGDMVQEVLADTPAADSGDEPALIQRRTGVPVFVAPHRADAARALLTAHPEVDLLLCDDGLQHLALGRDLAIAVFDERGTGNGWLLPAGLLREPWPPRGETRFQPDLVLHQHRDNDPPATLPVKRGLPSFSAVRRLADHAVGLQGQITALESLTGQPLTAVAGIARPEVFFDMLRARGLTLTRTVALPDHATPADYATLLKTPGQTLLCTEKDAVKLLAVLPAGTTVWAVPLELRPAPDFFEAIDQRLPQRKPAR